MTPVASIEPTASPDCTSPAGCAVTWPSSYAGSGGLGGQPVRWRRPATRWAPTATCTSAAGAARCSPASCPRRSCSPRATPRPTDEHYLDEEAGRRLTARRLLDLLDRRVSPGRLLDVGSGHGLLMAEARDRGWDPTGLELSRAGAAHARAWGCAVLEQTIEEAGFAPESFEAIAAVDLIEHSTIPASSSGSAASCWCPAGRFWWRRRIPRRCWPGSFGRRWWGYIPSHLHLLPRRMLRELLQTEGFALADDVAMVRDFSLRYLVSGLAGRSGLAEPPRRAARATADPRSAGRRPARATSA